MEIKRINNKDKVIKVTENGVSIELTLQDVREIEAIANCFYFRQDVLNQIEIMCHNGDLPEEARSNDEWVDEVIDCYSDLREKNDGDSEGMNWKECLEEAFNNVPYED